MCKLKQMQNEFDESIKSQKEKKLKEVKQLELQVQDLSRQVKVLESDIRKHFLAAQNSQNWVKQAKSEKLG